MIDNQSKSIIFDLDGTLVDSSESVIESIERAFSICNIKLLKPMSSAIIGPPLIETLKVLSGISDKVILNLLAEKFKENYDSTGFKKTVVFSGINEMLNDLNDNGFQLYIATNKRNIPTNKIINYLGWNSLFRKVYSLDSFKPSVLSKKDILAKIIDNHNLLKKNVIYVGDLEDDKISARANNIGYIMVEWGYENKDISKDTIHISSPKDLSNKLLKF
jgi:phosphoglycolate phosphatase